MAKTVSVDRGKVKALLSQIGLRNADKYTDAKILGALASIDTEDDTIDPGKYKKLFAKIVKANKGGAQFELTGDAPAAAKASKNGKASASAKEDKKGKNKDKKSKPSDGGGGGNGRVTDKDGRTAKDRVYLEWKSRKGDAQRDYEGIQKKAKADSVKRTTISSWCSGWKNGRGLPRVASKK